MANVAKSNCCCTLLSGAVWFWQSWPELCLQIVVTHFLPLYLAQKKQNNKTTPATCWIYLHSQSHNSSFPILNVPTFAVFKPILPLISRRNRTDFPRVVTLRSEPSAASPGPDCDSTDQAPTPAVSWAGHREQTELPSVSSATVQRWPSAALNRSPVASVNATDWTQSRFHFNWRLHKYAP